ncbi:hypothetical protein IAD21_06052 [Abditibacteriota bacterium]|nr:hypothetical protein IAD21_06052 [Abditibacteriota bacterium]
MSQILGHHFIGRVHWLKPELNIGGIEPLWMEKSDNSLLQPVNPSWFPEDGQVFWSFPPEDADVGGLWRFMPKENQKGSMIRQAYAVSHAVPANVITVADLRCWGRERVRRDLTRLDCGLKLPFDIHGLVYLWLEDELWLGPVSPYWEDGRWFLAPQDCKEPLRCVFPASIGTLIPTGMLRAKDHASHFLLKTVTNLRSAGQLDWSSDEVVLKRVLRTGGVITQAQIDQLISALDPVLLADSASLLEKDRRDRAVGLRETIKRNHRAADAYADTLLAIPAVQEVVSKEKIQILTRYRAEIEGQLKELREEISVLQDEKSTLSQGIAEYSKECDRLEREVKEKVAVQTQTITEKVEEAQNVLRTRWQTFRRDVIPDLAELEFLRVLMGAPSPPSPVGQLTTDCVVPSARPKASWPWPACAVGTHSTTKDFLRTLKKSITATAFRSTGTAGLIARSLTAIFLADAFPVLAGDGARAVLEAFGSVAVGGRVLTLGITPNYLEPSNLCGSPRGNDWKREQNGLLDLLESAQQSQADKEERLFLIVLEGINRAPVEFYLLPFLRAFRHRFSAQPNVFYPLPGTQTMRWPSNVLLAATMCDGVARVAPGSAFWSDAVLLHLESFTDDDEGSLPTHYEVPIAQVSLTQWQEWRKAPGAIPGAECDEILSDGLEQNLGLRRDMIPQSRQLWSQLNHISNADSERIIAQWMSLALPAPLVSAGKREQGLEWIKNGTHAFEGWQRSLECAQRCLS